MSTRRLEDRRRPADVLTPRQIEVLGLVARGHTNGQIAERLGITLDGAKFHVSEILVRLDVASREEAAAAWRAERGAGAAMRRMAGALFGSRLALAGLAATVVLVVGVAVGVTLLVATPGDGGEPAEASAPTAEDIVGAVTQPGRVYYAESEMVADGALVLFREWYSPDLEAFRREIVFEGELEAIQIVTDDRDVDLNLTQGTVYERPLQPLAAAGMSRAASQVSHVGAAAGSSPDHTTDVAMQRTLLEGVPVIRVDVVSVLKDIGAEEPPGTTTRMAYFLDAATLLPISAEGETRSPDGELYMAAAMTWTRAEFVDAASLPAGHFDADALASREVTLAEALDIAGQQAFATFWLGPSIPVEMEWHTAPAPDELEVVNVSVPGLGGQFGAPDKTLRMAYGPRPAPSMQMILIEQGPTATFASVDEAVVAAMRAAGNVIDLPGLDGFVYTEGQGPDPCRESLDAPGCGTTRVTRGAVVRIDGTTVHLIARPVMTTLVPNGGDVDLNPLNNPAALAELAASLERIP